MKTIYIARLKENEPQLVKATFSQETKRAIYVQHGENEMIIGDKPWFTVRVRKDHDTQWFGTEPEALEWLMAQIAERIEYHNARAEELRNTLHGIRKGGIIEP